MQRRHVIFALAAAALLLAAWQVTNMVASADVGAAAMAKVSCSCVFVEGRELADCRKDNPPGFDSVQVSVDPAARTATGSVFGLIHRKASYSPDYGCTLEP